MSEFSIRRREFVAGATAAAAGMAISSDALARDSNSMYGMTAADFAQLVGQSFAVEGTNQQDLPQRGTLVLRRVVAERKAAADQRPAHVRGEAFALHFEARDVALADGSHRIRGGNRSACAVFLQEMVDQRDDGRRYYEAVFN